MVNKFIHMFVSVNLNVAKMNKQTITVDDYS